MLTAARSTGSTLHSAIGAIVLLSAVAASCRAQERESDASLCRTAGVEAEARFGLPPGLLAAIGRVESGRPDPASGGVVAWPWTINANGAGRTFASATAAVTETRALQGLGMSSIDVGCFQISLLHHPAAFSSLEQAFDPKANADYAARFLSTLYKRLGTWETAISAYHSSAPERGQPYRDRVLAGWSMVREQPTAAVLPRINVIAWTAPASGGAAVKVWRPSASGLAAHVIIIASARNPGL